MKYKRFKTLTNFFLCAVLAYMVLLLVGAGSGAADKSLEEDERWKMERAKNGLVEQENLLLKRNDQLGLYIFELKQKRKAVEDELSSAQKEADRIRHELIVIRLKLLP